MSAEIPKIRLTTKVRIQKYAEGDTPETAEPFEIVEKEVVLEGAEAEQFIKEMGGNIDGITK